MAPTEILAEQHFRSIYELVEPLGIRVDLLKGGQRKTLRNQILANLANGQTQIAIGTHALIEDPVQFKRLGLTVIDEQHKFGVMQRARLWQKNRLLFPHNLAMTATPIPRTLAMTVYGDIDVSIIDELPPGRKPIITAVRPESHRLRVLGFVEEQLALGQQAYFVYPLVEESESLDLMAVNEGFEAVRKRYPKYHVSIVHGQMDPETKDYEMQRFKKGETRILVATTVIEVGVNVPSANVMVIENAERFGLSQLHQLRGRVGRGAEQAYCILMTKNNLQGKAKDRLFAMTQTNDGFRIAEMDLKLRGPGDFLGTRQSGLPEFKLADIVEDGALLKIARDAAFGLIREDPELNHPDHAHLKFYLGKFMRKNNLQELNA
jgi:ATP-dependent DNA helicase RecG